MLSLTVNAQSTTTVSGIVTSLDGEEPLPGVNVHIKGTTTGTITDIDGKYQLEVPENATLVFSFIGFITEEIVVENQSVINIELSPDIQTLTEVVVVGYGTQKRSDVTGSIGSVDEKSLREVPVASVDYALQGKVAGVNIMQTSSRPGSAAEIRIRGNRSLGSDDSEANRPLIVLDGIPYSGSLTDINPNDISAVDILKDASATAIYGSRGSNGVIIITTKRGKPGKPRLSYNGYYGVSSTLGKYDLMDGEQYAKFKLDANTYEMTATEERNLFEGREVDWQDLVYQNGYITNHELSLSGGTEETQYAISTSYFDQTTVLPGQRFERFSLRGVLDQQVTKSVKIGMNTLNSLSYRDGESTSPMFQLLTLSPLYDAYTEDGEINNTPGEGSIDQDVRNPLLLYRDDAWSQERRTIRSFSSLYGEVQIIDGLKYRLNIGFDFNQSRLGSFTGSETPMGGGGVNRATLNNSETWSYTLENLILYEKTFNEKHNIKFTGLYSVQEQEGINSQFQTTGIPADYAQWYNFELGNSTTAGDGNDNNDNDNRYYKWGLMSYMGRLNYNYDDRYLLTLTLRSDGSSRLAEGNKWFTYPAVAMGWNIYKEDFMSNVTLISNLKLRMGWGKTSNQNIAPYASLGRLKSRVYSFGEAGYSGYYVSSIPNPGLTWEFTTTANIGVDFGLLTNRITTSIDLYKAKTTDILQERSLPIMSGITDAYYENVGATKGEGIEILTSAIIIEDKNPGDFGMNLDFTFSAHRDKITQLYDTLTEDKNNGWFVGQPINVIYDYQKIGIWQTDEAEEAMAFDGRLPGDIKVKDINGNGVRDDGDRIVVGDLDPKWMAGLTARFKYKGFDLSTVAFLRWGGTLVSTFYMANQSDPYNTLEGRRNGPDVDYWTPDNPTNKYPRTGLQNPVYGTTLGYFDATYLKIRSINLGYTLPESLISKAGITNARVYFTINNPFKAFMSDYVKEGGLDPETTSRGTAENAVVGVGRALTVRPDTPPTRSFIFGVNLSL